MADSSYTAGDTWPPQKFRAKDLGGTLVDFSGADELKALIRAGTILISGTAVAIWPPEEDANGDEWNAKLLWQEHDLDNVAENYGVELKCIWDAESSPPKIQTFPNKNPRPSLAVVESNED